MTNKKQIVLTSDTKGLWMRFLSKVIPFCLATVLYFYLQLSSGDPILSPFNWGKVTTILQVLLCCIAISILFFPDYPLRWDNTVVFDFEQKLISIYKSRDIRLDQDILDFPEVHTIISDPSYIRSKQYESFLFEPFYLIRVSSGGKDIPLVSIKNPMEYTQLVDRLLHEMNLPLK